MSCSNCYNGCAEIVSDKCVKYTGVNVPVLGIQTGDSLSYIEQSLIEFLTSTLNGEGILPAISPALLNPDTLCTIVKANLPTCGEITLNGYIETLIKSVCNLQNITIGLGDDIAIIEADYDLVCIDEPGVFGSSGTHAVLQAVINKLCALSVDLAALTVDVDANYVKISDLDALIQDYLDSIGTSTKHYLKMVPYTVVEYYGSLSNFDGTGAGIGDWEKIYLCNGANGTPDKRGRVGVGAIVGVGGGSLDPVVTPGGYSPNYALNAKAGANSVSLSTSQLPSHTHSAVVTDTHYHYIATSESTSTTADIGSTDYTARSGTAGTNPAYELRPGTITANVGKTSGSQNSISVANSSTGSGDAHSNIQPVLACYYIMYIP